MNQPILYTDRLLLRPFELSDAKQTQQLAGNKLIAETTLLIPHPYPDGAAEEWISTHAEKSERGIEYVYAVTLKESFELIGAIGIVINKMFNSGETGYWVGVPYWNKGYITEALGALINFAFTELKLNKVYAFHLSHNLASGKVMTKNGMQKEGYFRKHIFKDKKYHDAVFYGILKEDYLENIKNDK